MSKSSWSVVSTSALLITSLTFGCALGSKSETEGAGPDAGGSAGTPRDAGTSPFADAWGSGGGTTVDARTSTGGGADAAVLAGRNGYPGDFDDITDSGGSGNGEVIAGFGGDDTTDQAGNRAQITRRPVILLHGNGTNTTDDNFGMIHIRDMLLAAGYTKAEIWAPSYLGQNISIAETPTPHRTNIDDVRRFSDAVMAYLGVDKVDFITHSLGCGMANAYMRGLDSTGSFDTTNHRMDRVGTVVCLGGAVYGTGYGFLYAPEFDVGGTFTTASLDWSGVEDATPYGAGDEGQMVAPSIGTIPGNRAFKKSTSLDGGGQRIWWVALWADGDIVDGNLDNACALQGADVNQGFDLPDSLPGVLTAALARHGHLLRSQDVFDALLPFLNR